MTKSTSILATVSVDHLKAILAGVKLACQILQALEPILNSAIKEARSSK